MIWRKLFAVLVFCALVVSPSSAKHENWVEVRSENFIIVSNAGEKEARQTAMQMEQVRALFRRSLAVASQHKSPVITMLAVKNEDSMKELLPDYWAKGHAHLAGIFLYRWDVYFAAANLAAGGANPLKTIYHEYYHSLTMPYFPNLPLWLAEGLADFYGSTEIKEKEAIIGEANPNLLWELRTNQIIPLDVLFKVDHSSPYYNEEKKTGVFYAESWALTHYLMIGDRMAHRPMFLNYLNALNQGENATEAAAIAFGDLGKLQSQLVNYINNSHYLEFKAEAPPAPPEGSLKTRPVSDAEADAYRGGFEVIRGKPEDAKPMLLEAVQLDPKLALAHEYLALAQLSTNQRAEAIASFGKAIELDPANELTRFLRAQMLFGENRGQGENTQIEEDLRAAIAANPDFVPPYNLLSVYLVNQRRKLPEALAFAQKAVSLEPGNSACQISLARALLTLNRYEEAQSAGSRARAYARNSFQQAQAEQFLAILQQVRNSAGAATSSGTTKEGQKLELPTQGQAGGHSLNIDAKIAEGLVGNVRCTDSELFLEITTGSGNVNLHARDFTHVPIEQDVPFESGEFQPCKELNGHKVRITYLPAEKKPYDGEIQSIEIEK